MDTTEGWKSDSVPACERDVWSTDITAAHLSLSVGYADLNGNLLISNDPDRGVTVRNGKLILPDGSGIGLQVA